jgi:membrane protease YdiL (CAAX protease family)
MISLSIIAPLNEELIFRKSLSTIIKNKYVFAICSGLLFGGAHLLTNVLSGSFVISDLIYLLPYSSLGVSFAIMNYETDSTFTSIFMHCIHNTCTGLLLLMVASMGAI